MSIKRTDIPGKSTPSGPDIEASASLRRKNMINALQQCSKMNPLIGGVYLRDTLLNDTHSMQYLDHLKEQVEQRLATNQYKNNSSEWETNLHNIDFPDVPNYVDIEKDRPVLSRFLTTEKTEGNSGILGRNVYYPQDNSRTEIVSNQNNGNGQNSDTDNKRNPLNVFKSAGDLLDQSELKKLASTYNMGSTVPQERTLQRNKSSKFVSPLLKRNSETISKPEEPEDERLKNIDPKIIELIRSEIMDTGSSIEWDDIAGLQFAKTAIKEAVVWPMLRPDIFTGLRRPPKGILLFGPPGTGKTLIGKCVASQSKSTFFSISASSLTSKWVGEGEKMVRALFTIARCHQPAVIFIDEIDSLLSQRSESEHESSRRIKTEFLVQLDGARTDNEERLLIIGATNRPQELDEAARRRFVKRLYIPLPANEGRLQLLRKLMQQELNSLTEADFSELARLSDGYSGADIKTLCSDACLGPIRGMNPSDIENIKITEVRPVSMQDFTNSLARVRSSVSPNDLEQYIQWDNTYGSGSGF